MNRQVGLIEFLDRVGIREGVLKRGGWGGA